MSFKQLFTGGACQPSGERFAQSANPLTTFVNAALVRPSATRQLIHAPQQVHPSLEAEFNQPLLIPVATPLPSEAMLHQPPPPALIHSRPYEAMKPPAEIEQLNSFWDAPIEKRATVAPDPLWFRVSILFPFKNSDTLTK